MTGSAVLARPLLARAESANIFLRGYNLPLNLDPHQVLDVSIPIISSMPTTIFSDTRTIGFLLIDSLLGGRLDAFWTRCAI